MRTLGAMANGLDLVLARVDRVVHTPLPTIPMQLGKVGERRVLAVIVAVAALLCLRAPSPAVLPARVVHLPSTGWVDAAAVPNLPAAVQDGDRLTLAVVGAAPGAGENEPSSFGTATGAGTTPPELGATVASGSRATEPPHAAALGRKLSLNHSTAAELESLPGVGPALAARIVAGRPYASVAQLERVRGIGEKTRARLAPLVEP